MVIKIKKPVFVLNMFVLSVIMAVILFDLLSSAIHTLNLDNLSQKVSIIIDPGHGGKDGGGEAPDGTYEKNLNLDISLKLRQLFNISGFNTVMTREDDSSTDGTGKFNKRKDILNRIKLIEKQENGVLISVHLNKFSDSQYSGAQFFYTIDNPKGRIMAETLQEFVKTYLQPDNNRSAKPIPNSVFLFKKVKLPAVLAECGFLSNPLELSLLKTDDYRMKMAIILYLGIQKYISYED